MVFTESCENVNKTLTRETFSGSTAEEKADQRKGIVSWQMKQNNLLLFWFPLNDAFFISPVGFFKGRA